MMGFVYALELKRASGRYSESNQDRGLVFDDDLEDAVWEFNSIDAGSLLSNEFGSGEYVLSVVRYAEKEEQTIADRIEKKKIINVVE
jgi:hypothetical protein